MNPATTCRNLKSKVTISIPNLKMLTLDTKCYTANIIYILNRIFFLMWK